LHTVGRTIKMIFNNILYLTREHHFDIALIPLTTEQYILTNT